MNEDELDHYELEILRAGERQELIEDEVLICECMCISAKDIRDHFNSCTTLNLESLKDKLQLGSGCSSCVKSFSMWKDKIIPQ